MKQLATSKKKAVVKPPVDLDSLLDETPTEPKVYIGVFQGVQRRSAIVYKRDAYNVWTVMFSAAGGQRVCQKWGADTFAANMRPAPIPAGVKGRVYPLERAVDIYMQPWAVFEDAAYRVLTKLKKGQDPEAEDTLDDLLDITPSEVKPRGLRGVRSMRTEAEKAERRRKRAAKFENMTPAALKAFRDARNAKRKLRRANKRKGATK